MAIKKILMRDIKSGSKRLKEIFRNNYTKRTKRHFFANYNDLTNDEILELTDLLVKEYNGKPDFILAYMIDHQKGPFNAAVVKKYIELINVSKGSLSYAILPMFKNVDNSVSEDLKYELMKVALGAEGMTHDIKFNKFFQFVFSGEAKQYGIDLDKEPWKRAYMTSAFTDKNSPLNGDRKKLFDYFDEMNENELFKFYIEVNKLERVNKFLQFAVWSEYSKTPEKILEHYAKKIDEDQKVELTKHPNCPIDLKMEVYEKTGDESILPQQVQDIFIF